MRKPARLIFDIVAECIRCGAIAYNQLSCGMCLIAAQQSVKRRQNLLGIVYEGSIRRGDQRLTLALDEGCMPW